MFLPSFCYSPEQQRQIAAQKKARIEKRLETCVDWHPNIKWEPALNIKAKSFVTHNLFPECVESAHPDPNREPDKGITSPNGKFLYLVKQVPRGIALDTWYGWKTGTVVFDGQVLVPALHQRSNWEKNNQDELKWRDAPWMSHTPAEIISMRGGTKRAKGRVIVAGLGLGYQLIEVSKRKQVTELVLLEKEQELVDWILPRVRPLLGERFRDKLEVIVGDAMAEMPKLTADVGLVDIFDSYGNNDHERDQLRRSCRNIGYIWCWGSAQLKDSAWSGW